MNDIQKELFLKSFQESRYVATSENTGKDYPNISVSAMVNSLIKMKRIFNENMNSGILRIQEITKEYNKIYVDIKENGADTTVSSMDIDKLHEEELSLVEHLDYVDGCIDTIDFILASIKATNILNA